MRRLVVSIVATPLLLVVLLAAVMDMRGSELGSLTSETFELGPLPVALMIAAVMLLIFLPLLALTAIFAKPSWWSTIAVGFVSALLPIMFSAWPVLTNTRLRSSFKIDYLADRLPLLAMGAIGGLVFWLIAVRQNRALLPRSEKS